MRRPIGTINPVIGDESFVAMFGRLPTPYDDPRLRAATHVGYVAKMLRERNVADPRRAAALDALDAYVATGAFPTSETNHGLLPTFLDAHTNVRCAVAHLVEQTAGTTMMIELDRDHHNDYIADLAGDPRFVAWTESSGLTHAELELIQPSYGEPPHLDVNYGIFAEADSAIHDDSPAATTHALFLADPSIRAVGGRPVLIFGKLTGELDGRIGMTNGEHLAYDARAKVGGEYRNHVHALAYSVGIGIDRYGPATPRAWTLPIDLSYQYDIGDDDTVGVHGGPRLTLDGDRAFGWNAGIDAQHHHLLMWAAFRDIDYKIDVTKLGDNLFFGVSVGVFTPREHFWGEP